MRARHIDPREGLRTAWRGLRFLAAASPRTALLYTALVAALAVLPVAQAWLAKLVVDEVAAGGERSVALALATLYALTLLASAAAQPLQQALNAWLTDRAVAEVDRGLMGAGARLADLARLERPSFHDALEPVHEVAWRGPVLFRAIEFGLGGTVTLAGLFALLAGLHPLLPLVLLVTFVPHLLAEQRNAKIQYEAVTTASRPGREMEYYARIATEPDAAKEVRVFGLGGFFLRRYEERMHAALADTTGARLRYLRISVLLGGAYALALAGGFWYVASRAGAGALSLGDLALYLNAVIQVQRQTGFLWRAYGTLYAVLLHIRGLFRLLDDAGPSVALPPAGAGLPAPARLRRGVELRGVSFAYPESGGPVLDGVDLTLRAGEITALVGANGAGKSTLVKLLTRMYDPTGGEILLDGRPLREYDLESLRSRIAVAYQDFARFSLTLRENIAVGAAEPGRTDGEMERATALSGANEVAAGLPHSYDTELTRRFEGGVDLSGGQWQRVALARAFIRRAALVILDEPTSALDADAEHRLLERFKGLVRGRTALIISHRFSTVRMADRIAVLEDGRVAEEGAHEELLALGGRYTELFEMQAGRYR